MKIFVAGASGAIGKQLVPLLVDAGYEVVGTTTSAGKADDLRALGAEPLVLDLLDAEAVGRAVSEAVPDVVIHEATALAPVGGNLRKFDEAFAQTNRLRTEGTDTSSPLRGPWACGSSSPRAMPTGRTHARRGGEGRRGATR
jgi:nucleoside-diphosphate-sugar epimerase